jgi:hypothetical protein
MLPHFTDSRQAAMDRQRFFVNYIDPTPSILNALSIVALIATLPSDVPRNTQSQSRMACGNGPDR